VHELGSHQALVDRAIGGFPFRVPSGLAIYGCWTYIHELGGAYTIKKRVRTADDLVEKALVLPLFFFSPESITKK